MGSNFLGTSSVRRSTCGGWDNIVGSVSAVISAVELVGADDGGSLHSCILFAPRFSGMIIGGTVVSLAEEIST